MSGRSKNEIAGIDYLRLSAAVLVMAYHFLFWDRLTALGSDLNAVQDSYFTETFFEFGWVGVEIFFVISGYVIAFSAEGRTAISFLKGRALRLIPGIWICATLELLVLLYTTDHHSHELFSSWVKTITLWPRGQINGVYWTLQIEICFYLIVLCMIWSGLRKFIEPLLIALGICSGIFWFVEIGASGSLHDVLESKGNGIIFRGLLITHGSFFATGIVLYKGFRTNFSSRRLLFLTILFICCCVEIEAHRRWLAAELGLPLSIWKPTAIFVIAYAFIFVSVKCNDLIATKIGENGLHLTRLAGRMTFPLYLIHQAVGVLVAYALAPRYGWLTAPFAMTLAFGAAYVIDRYPEKWLRHAMRAVIQPPARADIGLPQRNDQRRAEALLRDRLSSE